MPQPGELYDLAADQFSWLHMGISAAFRTARFALFGARPVMWEQDERRTIEQSDARLVHPPGQAPDAARVGSRIRDRSHRQCGRWVDPAKSHAFN